MSMLTHQTKRRAYNINKKKKDKRNKRTKEFTLYLKNIIFNKFIFSTVSRRNEKYMLESKS